jgi:hypothetical protein
MAAARNQFFCLFRMCTKFKPKLQWRSACMQKRWKNAADKTSIQSGQPVHMNVFHQMPLAALFYIYAAAAAAAAGRPRMPEFLKDMTHGRTNDERKFNMLNTIRKLVANIAMASRHCGVGRQNEAWEKIVRFAADLIKKSDKGGGEIALLQTKLQSRVGP